MHVLIALITAVVSLLYALERLGIDVGWINPWAWRRKRKWLKQYHAKPSIFFDHAYGRYRPAFSGNGKNRW